MASPQLHGRRVDLGAGYFTVRDPEFAAVVRRWQERGLVRPWTDTFGVLALGEAPGVSSGPMRWATPRGLRSLVRELLEAVPVQTASPMHRLPAGDVILAMPDPQAARLVTVPDTLDYDPVIAVACGFPERTWPFADAAFVHHDPTIDFVADDGARRGDGAPVLVAHSTVQLARSYLDGPDAAAAPVVAALRELLPLGEPLWTHAHRWTFAKPAGQHGSSYHLAEAEDGTRLGLAGDQWCPSGTPRVESAWRSGTDLGRALADVTRT
jgi:renalase